MRYFLVYVQETFHDTIWCSKAKMRKYFTAIITAQNWMPLAMSLVLLSCNTELSTDLCFSYDGICLPLVFHNDTILSGLLMWCFHSACSKIIPYYLDRPCIKCNNTGAAKRNNGLRSIKLYSFIQMQCVGTWSTITMDHNCSKDVLPFL